MEGFNLRLFRELGPFVVYRAGTPMLDMSTGLHGLTAVLNRASC